VSAVARSIREYGFKVAIVVDADGVIICGHTRYKAALQLGLREVPVHIADNLTPAQVKAFRIADNQLASLSEFDTDLLSAELAQLKALEYDLSVLGFESDELLELLSSVGNAGLVDPDAIPTAVGQAVSQRGDLWILGEHRLLVGDSSSADDLDRLLNGAPVHLVNTDPPYNVKVEPRSNNAFVVGETTFHPVPESSGRRDQPVRATTQQLRARDRPLKNDCVSDADFTVMLGAWFGNIARVLIPGGGFYIWGGYANIENYPPVLRATGLYFSQTIIWDKQHPVLTRKDFMGAHEWSFYGWKEGAAHRFFGPANIPDLWHVKKVSPQAMIHLTEKPVELAARAMQYSTRRGENVLDLFGGSGSTLIAAEQQGRKAFLMELDELYADTIVMRFQTFTGKQAILERTGQTFEQVRAAALQPAPGLPSSNTAVGEPPPVIESEPLSTVEVPAAS